MHAGENAHTIRIAREFHSSPRRTGMPVSRRSPSDSAHKILMSSMDAQFPFPLRAAHHISIKTMKRRPVPESVTAAGIQLVCFSVSNPLSTGGGACSTRRSGKRRELKTSQSEVAAQCRVITGIEWRCAGRAALQPLAEPSSPGEWGSHRDYKRRDCARAQRRCHCVGEVGRCHRGLHRHPGDGAAGRTGCVRQTSLGDLSRRGGGLV